jgi:hypothetical protein
MLNLLPPTTKGPHHMAKSLKGKPGDEEGGAMIGGVPASAKVAGTGMSQSEFMARNAEFAKTAPKGGITEQPAFLGIPMGPEKRIQ